MVDVLANDIHVIEDDRKDLRIVVAPSCGAAEAREDGVLYISNENCVGAQMFSYCVARKEACVEATVTVQVAPQAARPRLMARAAPETPAQRAAPAAKTVTRIVTESATAPAGDAPRAAALAPPPMGAQAPSGAAGVAATVRPLTEAPGLAGRAAVAPLVLDHGGDGPATPASGPEGLTPPGASAVFEAPAMGRAPAGIRVAALELDAADTDTSAPDLSELMALGGMKPPAPAAETVSEAVAASLAATGGAGDDEITRLRAEAEGAAAEATRPAVVASLSAPDDAEGGALASSAKMRRMSPRGGRPRPAARRRW